MTLTETTKQNLVAGSVMSVLLAIPAIGCWLAIAYNSPWWLLLLLPLFVFMEAGLFFAIVAWLGVSFYMGW